MFVPLTASCHSMIEELFHLHIILNVPLENYFPPSWQRKALSKHADYLCASSWYRCAEHSNWVKEEGKNFLPAALPSIGFDFLQRLLNSAVIMQVMLPHRKTLMKNHWRCRPTLESSWTEDFNENTTSAFDFAVEKSFFFIRGINTVKHDRFMTFLTHYRVV